MANVRFQDEYTHRIDENTRKTWPVGWSGELNDEVAFAARKAGAAEFIGEGAAEAEAAFQSALVAVAPAPAGASVEIPGNWESFNAAETIDLARKLGAGDDVKTKGAASDYIAAIVAKQSPLL